MRRFFDSAALSLSLLLGTSVSLPVEAANFDDPTWPCVQRKVPNLSIGQMWSGQIVAEDNENIVNDDSIEVVAAALAVRRTSMEEAADLIDAFAKASGDEKNERLTQLFANVFERIDSERSQIIGGVARYAGKQSGLADRVEALNEEYAALDQKEDKSNDDYDRLEEVADKIDWDTRIFEERQQSLTYVCETPVLLEKRAFALARMIMQRMD